MTKQRAFPGNVGALQRVARPENAANREHFQDKWGPVFRRKVTSHKCGITESNSRKKPVPTHSVLPGGVSNPVRKVPQYITKDIKCTDGVTNPVRQSVPWHESLGTSSAPQGGNREQPLSGPLSGPRVTHEWVDKLIDNKRLLGQGPPRHTPICLVFQPFGKTNHSKI